MIEDIKHNEKYEMEEYDYDNAINELFNSLDLDTLITLYFYADMIVNLSNIKE